MKRLDQILVDRGLCPSREKAQALILSGVIYTGERRLDKAGTRVAEDLPIEIRGEASPYVSRAGEKLEAALKIFGLSPKDRIALDVGASTGGFTDCLLQRGAKKVFAVDVGRGQLDMKLRNDPRVVVLEKQNARYLTMEILREADQEAPSIDLVCIDCSFISLKVVIPPIKKILSPPSEWILLFKPQFEVGKSDIRKGGVPKSQEVVERALRDFQSWMDSQGFTLKGGPENSPITGKKSGNVEFLFWYETN